MRNIAIFASGTGSNARKIVEHFKGHPRIAVRLILSNRANAPVLGMAEEQGIESILIQRKEFYETEKLLEVLAARDIDFIVLAGFLWLIPSYLVNVYANRMVNIHPALLPKYGGKGMYGMHVHEAVKEAGEKETGITIHYVNKYYDEGNIIFQDRCPVYPEDHPEDIAARVRQLEHMHFAKVIEEIADEGY